MKRLLIMNQMLLESQFQQHRITSFETASGVPDATLNLINDCKML
jgi:hypothetical protein